MAKANAARLREVEAALKGVEDFYSLGLKLPVKQDHRDAYRKGAIAAAAAKYSVNEDTVRKARRFAAEYTRKQLDALCEQIRRVQGKQNLGKPVFTRTYAIRLLTVPTADRAALQKEAITGAWSLATLEGEIAERYGTRRDGGRPGRSPTTETDMLMQLDRLCETWCRWMEMVDPDEGEKQKRKAKGNGKEDSKDAAAGAGRPTVGGLPEVLRARIRAVGKQVERLQQAVAAELKERDPNRSFRSRVQPDEDRKNGRPTKKPQRGG